MKNILLPLVAIIFCCTAKAQVNCGTNAFPCSGSVGVGTSGPLVKLHVRGAETNTTLGASTNAAILIENNDGIAYGQLAELQFRNASDQTNAVIASYYSSYSSSIGSNQWGSHLIFGTKTSLVSSVQERMRLTDAGVLLIGTSTATYDSRYKLIVNGAIGTTEVYVKASSPWPDYVFGNNYKLLTLEQLDAYIQQNKHLPNMPSSEDVKNSGSVNLGEMNAKLLEKVEELTLYVIGLKKENEKIKSQLQELIDKQK